MTVHRFSVMVNCNLADVTSVTDKQQDFERLYEDKGFIMLPDSYTEDGKATRLVIFCHGAGGSVDVNDSQIEHLDETKYLVANGYAVMDINGLPFEYAEENNIDIRNNIGSPIAIRSYVKAYHYCIENFNLKPDVFVLGGSMGGISSTNLVLSGAIPVIAQAAFCPVLDTYNQIFLHPWSDGLSKIALGRIYGLDTDESGEYIYDEEKIMGHNPAKNKKAEVYPVPFKAWHCVDDPIVSYEVTKRFFDKIKENGGMAYLRTFPYGKHSADAVGDFIENPCGCDVFDGEKINIRPTAEEIFLWIKNFD